VDGPEPEVSCQVESTQRGGCTQVLAF